MDFELSPEQRQVRETFARFCDERVAPQAAALDEAHAFPKALFGELAQMGLFRHALPGGGRRQRHAALGVLPRARGDRARLDVARGLRRDAVADGHQVPAHARQRRHRRAPLQARIARRESWRHGRVAAALDLAARSREAADEEVAYWRGRLAESSGSPATAVSRYLEVLELRPFHPLAAAARRRLGQPGLAPEARRRGLNPAVRHDDPDGWVLGSPQPSAKTFPRGA